MKILTFNTWGVYGPYEDRWTLFVKLLPLLDPDVLCLQEVVDERLPKLLAQKLAFKHYEGFWEAGLCLMSRTPLSYVQQFVYRAKSNLENQIRGALVGTVQCQSQELLIGNTHLSWRTEDSNTRLMQLKELIEVTRNKKTASLLAGDFNDVRESAAVQQLEHEGFVDLYQMDGPDQSAVTWDNKNPFIQTHSVKFPDRRIDFLFANQMLLSQLSSSSCRIVLNRADQNGIYPSDHYGVLSELNF